MAEETYSQKQIDEAVERLSDPERFREAEGVVARAAPQLHKVLAAALGSGGWFGDAHEAETLKAATTPDPDERIRAVGTLLAEESRMAMMIGVAVGWELNKQLAGNQPAGSDHGDPEDHHGDPEDDDGQEPTER